MGSTQKIGPSVRGGNAPCADVSSSPMLEKNRESKKNRASAPSNVRTRYQQEFLQAVVWIHFVDPRAHKLFNLAIILSDQIDRVFLFLDVFRSGSEY